ncbi:MAG: AmmeMemoRadiSam system protein B [Anaerolineae bacterium]|nr:MAG: AmmeMemoRadiSam system protein B [Anaerolineae bacterium]WKZ42566.1 MAG: AmmeMemoRadiSam system protein B [Anaerolineales bacterium]
MLDVRLSPIAGTWYEGNEKTLARVVDKFLDEAQLPALSGEVVAIIAPHAGHRYSGAVAGYAFAAVRGLQPDLVAVISPFHNLSNYPLLTTAHDAYGTPLGNIEVDKAALAELSSHLEIPITPVYKDKEHSLEIELPFLQRALGGGKGDREGRPYKLLPIMIRAQEMDVAKKLGHALANVLKDKNALLVASTDLSHFYDQTTANMLDAEMLKRFESFEPESIFEAEQSGKAFACGHAAVAAVLWASRDLGASKVQILRHATSGDVTGDFSSVVGYGAGVVLKTKK